MARYYPTAHGLGLWDIDRVFFRVNRGSIKKPGHIWRPLHIQNSVLVYSNSMWGWRQRCQGSLIDSRYVLAMLLGFGLKSESEGVF